MSLDLIAIADTMSESSCRTVNIAASPYCPVISMASRGISVVGVVISPPLMQTESITFGGVVM